MKLAGSIALVTGANRGLGRHFAEQLLTRGATVYAGARTPASVDLPGAIPVALDVTDPGSIAAAVETIGTLSLLINNAGSATGASVLDGSLVDIRLEMETHYFGTLAVTRSFAPLLAASGGGALLNVLSVASWVAAPFSAYSAAKSAEWGLTNAVRLHLVGKGTQVSALYVGLMDTEMTSQITAPKSDPALIAKIALDGVEAGDLEIVADEISASVLARLSGGIAALYPQLIEAPTSSANVTT
jgi:NAD(P)-dependent dehydrogenase (short-subunit alcohol dehydrogenase family)